MNTKIEEVQETLPSITLFPNSHYNDWHTYPLGIGLDGEIVWSVKDASSLLVSGAKDRGKRNIACNLLRHVTENESRWDFAVVNIRGFENDNPDLTVDEKKFATSFDEGSEVIAKLYELCKKRYHQNESRGGARYVDNFEGSKPFLGIIENVEDLILPVKGDSEKIVELKKKNAFYLSSISQRGRSASVHIALFTSSSRLAELLSASIESVGTVITLNNHGIVGRAIVGNLSQGEEFQAYSNKVNPEGL